MMALLDKVYVFFAVHILAPNFLQFLLIFFPFILLIEIPYYLLILAAAFNEFLTEAFSIPSTQPAYPYVSCLVTCYNEGRSIERTLKSLQEQLYRGKMEVLVIIDGAEVNEATVKAVEQFVKHNQSKAKIHFRVVPKRTRGGHASSLNLGLKLSRGEIIISLDGDCSCDNDMVASVADSFVDPDVVGMSGNLRVRNAKTNLLTRLQAIEYMIGIHFARLALGKFNSLNNISSAFGGFRRSFLLKIGGWKNGSAEDFDLTIRLRAYFKRYPNLKLIHNKEAIVHTDAPVNWRGLLKQRLRWDGDMYYIACFRHWRVIRPKFLGWSGFIGFLWDLLLLHMVLPFLLIFGLIYLFVFYTFSYAVVVFSLTYLYYFIVGFIMFLVYWLLVSERKAYDLSFVPFLLLKPAYHIVLRIWSAVAIFAEMIIKTHRDSTMAPSWVNRKVD